MAIDHSTSAHPKTTRKKRQPRDGRLIESPSQYRKTKAEMWKRQGGYCECGRYIDTAEAGERHHPGGRGLGGGKRDDSKTVLICQPCHRRQHK
jgi:hypothetical protein